jgi:hypothetical protein
MRFDAETFKTLALLAAFSALGIWLFFDGFKKWRRKRLIENIPTSKVRSLAMGLVELIGQAEPRVSPIKGPITKKDCVFFKYLVERYEKRGKNSSWVRVAGDTSISPFYVDDSTGKVLVDPKNAEINFAEPDFSYEGGGAFGGSIPTNLENFLVANNIRYTSLFGTQRMRFREWDIYPDEQIYVLGTAEKNNDFISDYKIKLNETLAALKADSAAMKKLDTNGDGTVSIEEWEQGVNGLKQRMMEEELAKTGTGPAGSNIVITKGAEETIFLISEKSEKDFCQKLFVQACFEIPGGVIIASACIAFLVNLLSRLR